MEAWFDRPSRPGTKAEDDTAALRILPVLTDKGILTGTVVRIAATSGKLHPAAVPNHRVVANRWPCGTESTGFTNLSGRFEFELSPGSYDLNAATEQGLREAADDCPLLPPSHTSHLSAAHLPP